MTASLWNILWSGSTAASPGSKSAACACAIRMERSRAQSECCATSRTRSGPKRACGFPRPTMSSPAISTARTCERPCRAPSRSFAAAAAANPPTWRSPSIISRSSIKPTDSMSQTRSSSPPRSASYRTCARAISSGGRPATSSVSCSWTARRMKSCNLPARYAKPFAPQSSRRRSAPSAPPCRRARCWCPRARRRPKKP